MLRYAISMMEQLKIWLIDPITPEARLRVLNALLKENGIDEMPYILEETGTPVIAAEEYSRCLSILIEHAKKSLDNVQTVDIVPDEFRIVEVRMDESRTAGADRTA